MSDPGVEVRRLASAERRQLRELLAREWGSSEIVSRGRVHDASEAEAFGAVQGKELVGLATYVNEGGACELLTLNAFASGQGIGSALLEAVEQAAGEASCRRLWLITTNDNRDAIRFYERRGMRLVAIHRGAVDEARRLKPSIPEFAPDGTRISDEYEFELLLGTERDGFGSP